MVHRLAIGICLWLGTTVHAEAGPARDVPERVLEIFRSDSTSGSYRVDSIQIVCKDGFHPIEFRRTGRDGDRLELMPLPDPVRKSERTIKTCDVRAIGTRAGSRIYILRPDPSAPSGVPGMSVYTLTEEQLRLGKLPEEEVEPLCRAAVVRLIAHLDRKTK